MRALSVKEEKFVHSYIMEGGNLRKAAIDAGYSEHGATRAAMRLIKKARVNQAIEAAKAKLAEENNFSKERMFKELELVIANARNEEYPNYAAILKAREMQCKMLGYFEPDKQEINSYDVSISVLEKKDTPPAPPEPPPHTPQIPDFSEATLCP